MNEKTRYGVLTFLLGLIFYFIPFLLNKDHDLIVTIFVVSMFGLSSVILMMMGWDMVKGKKSNLERIEELEKRVETLESSSCRRGGGSLDKYDKKRVEE